MIKTLRWIDPDWLWLAVLTALFFVAGSLARADDNAIARWGTPTADYLTRPGYLVSFDGRTRQPRWVLERLTADSLAANVSRAGKDFRQDHDVPAEFRPSVADYHGFDLGHLAAAANHCGTAAELDATFLLSNASPQLAPFNRGVWKQGENEVRRYVTCGPAMIVWVASGPLFLADGKTVSYATVGEHDLAVPTHFFKSILVQHGNTRRMATWLIPHQATVKPWNQFRVTTDDGETAAGFDFWNGLDDDEEDRLEAGDASEFHR